MRYLVLISLALIVILFAQCKRITTDEPVPDPGYFFENKTPRDITVELMLFPKQGEPFSGLIYHSSVKVPAGQKAKVQGDNLEYGIQYIYNWYSDDYKYYNWNRQEMSSFIYKTSAYSVMPLDAKPRKDMLICLSGYGSETQWKLADVFDENGVSIWNTLPYHKKINNFVIIKNRQLRGIAGRFNGIDSNYATSYSLADTAERMWLYTSHVYATAFTNDLRPLAPLFTNSTDTIYCVGLKLTSGTPDELPAYKISGPPYSMFVKEATR